MKQRFLASLLPTSRIKQKNVSLKSLAVTLNAKTSVYLCRMLRRLLEMAVVHACYGIDLSGIVQYWTKVITLIFDAEIPFSPCIAC